MVGTAFIFDAVRTPRGKGKKGGGLNSVKAVDLMGVSLSGLASRNELNTEIIDDVTVGCVTQVGEQGACIARTAILLAGFDETVPGVTLNRFCGSGLEAVNGAAAKVASGFCDVVVAGGVESMSRVKMGSDGGALWDPTMAFNYGTVPQGISADLLATKYGISRQRADEFAAESQRRATEAWARNAFAKSVIPVKDLNGVTQLDRDEHFRSDTTVEALGKLTPSFQMMGTQFGLDAMTVSRYPEVEYIDHIHTAGNSSGIVDGSAAVLLGNENASSKLGRAPRARIRSLASIGDEPVIMLTGPVPATEKALKQAGMTVDDIDLFEVNEAFAAVPLFFADQLNVPLDKINVNGGAIALGHPLGATGAVLLGTVLDELEARDLNTALVTLCIGGGMGIATVIERM